MVCFVSCISTHPHQSVCIICSCFGNHPPQNGFDTKSHFFVKIQCIRSLAVGIEPNSRRDWLVQPLPSFTADALSIISEEVAMELQVFAINKMCIELNLLVKLQHHSTLYEYRLYCLSKRVPE